MGATLAICVLGRPDPLWGRRWGGGDCGCASLSARVGGARSPLRALVGRRLWRLGCLGAHEAPASEGRLQAQDEGAAGGRPVTLLFLKYVFWVGYTHTHIHTYTHVVSAVCACVCLPVFRAILAQSAGSCARLSGLVVPTRCSQHGKRAPPGNEKSSAVLRACRAAEPRTRLSARTSGRTRASTSD